MRHYNKLKLTKQPESFNTEYTRYQMYKSILYACKHAKETKNSVHKADMLQKWPNKNTYALSSCAASTSLNL